MKLASLRHGRDGRLVVVSKDLTRAAEGPVPTLQALLDAWDDAAPQGEAIYKALNADLSEGFAFDMHEVAAPLPRARGTLRS